MPRAKEAFSQISFSTPWERMEYFIIPGGNISTAANKRKPSVAKSKKTKAASDNFYFPVATSDSRLTRKLPAKYKKVLCAAGKSWIPKTSANSLT